MINCYILCSFSKKYNNSYSYNTNKQCNTQYNNHYSKPHLCFTSKTSRSYTFTSLACAFICLKPRTRLRTSILCFSSIRTTSAAFTAWVVVTNSCASYSAYTNSTAHPVSNIINQSTARNITSISKASTIRSSTNKRPTTRKTVLFSSS